MFVDYISPEVLYGVGTVALMAVLVYGIMQGRKRNRANDPITEQATHDLYKDPEHYPQRREELKERVKPS